MTIGGSVPCSASSEPHAAASSGTATNTADSTQTRLTAAMVDVGGSRVSGSAASSLPGDERATQPRAGMSDLGAFPGAQAPDRQHMLDVGGGLRVAVHEWGDADAPPFFFVHGGFDFGRTYDVFAPRIAAAGWRVITWDQRGHGDSDHAALYGWDADLRDAMVVLDTLGGDRPIARARPQQGRFADDPAGRRPAVPLHPRRQPRRHPVPPPSARRRRARADADGRQRGARLARPPPAHGVHQPQAGHVRGARPAPGADEPAPVARLAAPPRVRRCVRVRRRLAVEDRRVDALRRLRAVATGVDDHQAARSADAVPRRARRADGGDGLGHRAQGGVPVAAGRRALRDPRRRRPLRPHRAARHRGRDGPRLRRIAAHERRSC